MVSIFFNDPVRSSWFIVGARRSSNMDVVCRSRVSAICLISMDFLAFGGFSYSVEAHGPKNVQVSLRAKWPGTSLLLEAATCLQPEQTHLQQLLNGGMAQLMKNPEILNKAQEEVRRIINGKGKVEENDLQHLHYLKLVIKETLRLNPPAPLLPPRECMKDTKINDYNIPAKTRVYVNVWSVGRDLKFWDDPDVFHPERFMTSHVNFKGNCFELIPFGSGRRMCPGITLAMASIELAFASILYEFDWKLPNGMTKDDIDMRAASGLVTPKKVPLILVATPSLTK